MTRRDLRFTAETAAAGEQILALAGDRILGAEIYTYGMLEPENAPGQLWAGFSSDLALSALLFDSGACRTFLTPDAGAVGYPAQSAAAFFAPIPFREKLCVMLNPAPAAAVPEGITPLSGAQLLEVAALLHGREPNDGEEKRFVYEARAINAGLAHAFGIYTSGRLIAAAQILAKNRRCALIGNVYTAQAYRGNGAATCLLAACEATAAAEGLSPVLYCRPEMRRFYRARGYRRVKNSEL